MKRIWKKYEGTRKISRIPTITISPNKISFSSKMIKEFNLEKKKSADIFYLDEDPYSIAFKFYNYGESDTAPRITKTASGSFSMAAGEYVAARPVLTKIAECMHRKDRLFEVTRDEDDSSMYVATLRPDFEISYDKYDFNLIDKNIKGIYRYINSKREIIYIGQGNIYDRLKDSSRKNWDISRVELSILGDKSACLKWEKYHLDKHKKLVGELPALNIISGHSSNSINKNQNSGESQEDICLT